MIFSLFSANKNPSLGQYTLYLTNDAGERSLSVQVKVLDVPAAAKHIDVENVMGDRCTVTWGIIDNDGGSGVTHYVLEKRETTRATWSLVSSEIKSRYYKVLHLIRDNEYIFR